jgi:diaminopimelate epimerase
MIPLLASANGNTFLIFDFIKNANNFKYLNMLFWFITKKVDSAIVIFKNNNSTYDCLKINFVVYFPKGGFCANGARVVSHYLHQKYSSINYKIIGDYIIDLVRYRNKFGIMFNIKESVLYCLGSNFHYVKILGEPHIITFDNRKLNKVGFYAQHIMSVNINHCTIINDNTIYVKTWERGICRYTQSCGTGVISCLLLCILLQKVKVCSYYNVLTYGGHMLVVISNGKLLFLGDTKVVNNMTSICHNTNQNLFEINNLCQVL